MQLQTRINWFVVVGFVLLGVLVATPLLIINHLKQQELNALLLDDYRSTWDTALAAAGSAILLQETGQANDLRNAEMQGNSTIKVERVDYFNRHLQLASSTAASASNDSLVNPEIMAREVKRYDQVVSLALVPGKRNSHDLLLIASRALQDGFVTVAAKPGVLVNFLKNGLNGHFFIIDSAGGLITSNNPALWKSVQPVFSQKTGVTQQTINDIFYSVSVKPVNDYAGYTVASLVVLQDITSSRKDQYLIVVLAAMCFLVLLTVLVVVLHSTLKNAMQPLANVARTIHSISNGDIFSPLQQHNRNDEVGEISRAVGVFQNHALVLAKRDFSEKVDQRSTRNLIDAEMQKITRVLEPQEQVALQQELEKVLQNTGRDTSSLALTFQLVTARVVEQQTRLTHVLAERSADLVLVRKALEERTHLNRLREELELASQLQASSLPRAEEAAQLRPWIDLYAEMRPAKEVGGDFYDYRMLDDRHLMLVVGDASGKGISAAMFVLMTRTLLRANVSLEKTPAQCLFETNNALERDNQAMVFTTVFLGILDLHSGILHYANAGHNPPYVLHPDGTVSRLDTVPGAMLGVVPDFDYLNASTHIKPGALLWMYSDGISEAHNPQQQLFGEEQMVQTLTACKAANTATLVKHVLTQVDLFAGTAEQFDDMTLLACRFQSAMHT